LHQEKRKNKRKAKEDKILQRVNKRRLAKDLEAVASIDDIKDDEDQPDPRLEETAEILQDFIQLRDDNKIAYVEQKQSVEQLEN